jgi:hypothetical protein
MGAMLERLANVLRRCDGARRLLKRGMDGRVALARLHAQLDRLREIVARAQRGVLTADEALRRIDAELGPPVRLDPVPRDSPLAAAVSACEAVVNDCRREIDRVRAGLVGPEDTLDAIRARLARADTGGPSACAA